MMVFCCLRNRKHKTMPLFAAEHLEIYGTLAICPQMRLLVCDGYVCKLPQVHLDKTLCNRANDAIDMRQFKFYHVNKNYGMLSIRFRNSTTGIGVSMHLIDQKPIRIVQRLFHCKRAARRLAIAMAMHARLGQKSELSSLPDHLLLAIANT